MKKLLMIILVLFYLAGCASNKQVEENNNEVPIEGMVSSNNVLVAYFSVTNHTKAIALEIQNYLDCDIFEIVPNEAYTEADINYNTDCRANREQNDASSRPEIKYQIEDMTKYDTIVLGYPIWWGQAPKIMYTFIESYDFTDKVIIPFCTSGSSPIGSSATNLAKSAPNASWQAGQRFAAGTAQDVVNNWLDQYFTKETEMKLFIDEQEISVTWVDNASTQALKELAPLEIAMHEYGGFEQTGSIGQTITSSDERINVAPGDIVLYNSNAISVFYNNSSWSYTRLGHINLSEVEIKTLLEKPNVTFRIEVK